MKKYTLILIFLILATCEFQVNAQSVGIGSSSFTPLNMLDVKGKMVIGSGYAGVNTAPADGLLIQGNTGIGTASPRGVFDVFTDGNIYLSNSTTTGTAQSLFLPGHIFIAPYSGTNISYVQARRSDNSGTTELQFRTYNAGSLNEALRINGLGNVGIGTTSPAAQLHTTGTVRFAGYPSGANGAIVRTDASGNLAVTNFTGNATNILLGNNTFGTIANAGGVTSSCGTANYIPKMSSSTDMTCSQIFDNGSAVGIGTNNPAQGKLWIQGGDIWTTGDNSKLAFSTDGSTDNTPNASIIASQNGISGASADLLFNTWNGASNVEIMRVRSNGKVGIGTTNPTYTLQVQKTSTGPALMIGGALYGQPRFQTYGLDADPNAWMGLGTDMGGGPYEHSLYFPTAGPGRLTIGDYNGTTYNVRMTVLQNGNVGIGTSSPETKMDISGTTKANAFAQNNNGLRLVAPDGASYVTSTSSVTGAIKITLPQFRSSTMMRMTIKIYQYTTDQSYTIELGGYNYVSGSWYNTFANVTSTNGANLNVRFGYDGTPKNCIWIGETGSVWSYPQIFVTDFQAGYSNYSADQWDDGWSISIVGAYNTVENTANPAFNTSGSGTTNYITKWTSPGTQGNSIAYDNGTNIGIGTASPAASLHLYQDRYTLYGPNSTWGAYLQVGGNGRVTSYASVAATNGNLHLDAADGGYATYINYYSQNNTYINAQAGNVGIGTTSPVSKLDVRGKATFTIDGIPECCGNDATIALGENTTGTGRTARISFHNSGVAEGSLELFNGSPRRLRIFDNQSQGMGLQMSGPLYVDGTGNSYIQGNVGIGTASPQDKLDIAGNVRIGSSATENTIRFYGLSGDGDGSYNHTVIAERLFSFNGSTSDHSELLFFKGNDVDDCGTPLPHGSCGDRIRFDTPGSIIFQTGNGYRTYDPSVEGNTAMIINTAGNVGIGTTTPGSQKLYATQTGIAGSGYATASVNPIYGYGGGASYSFGVTGYDCCVFVRAGGVHGAWSGGTWGALGYYNSGSTTYGGYFTSQTTGGGFMPESNGIGIGTGAYGGIIGSWTRGEVMGQISSGELFADYKIGNSYTSGVTADIVTTATERIPVYSVTSNDVKVYADGYAQLNNGTLHVNFDKTFMSVISSEGKPTVTITPIGECQGIYISEIDNNGFTVKEQNGGASSVEFSWIAIGKRVDADKVNQLPEAIKDLNFDKNMKGVMFNENNKEQNATPIWWDGTKLRFDTPPQDKMVKKDENQAPKSFQNSGDDVNKLIQNSKTMELQKSEWKPTTDHPIQQDQGNKLEKSSYPTILKENK